MYGLKNTPLEQLFADLLENAMKIGVMEDYSDKVLRGELPDIPTDLTRSAIDLYTRHYQLTWSIEDYIRERTLTRERSKSRFKRLFHK